MRWSVVRRCAACKLVTCAQAHCVACGQLPGEPELPGAPAAPCERHEPEWDVKVHLHPLPAGRHTYTLARHAAMQSSSDGLLVRLQMHMEFKHPWSPVGQLLMRNICWTLPENRRGGTCAQYLYDIAGNVALLLYNCVPESGHVVKAFRLASWGASAIYRLCVWQHPPLLDR